MDIRGSNLPLREREMMVVREGEEASCATCGRKLEKWEGPAPTSPNYRITPGCNCVKPSIYISRFVYLRDIQ